MTSFEDLDTMLGDLNLQFAQQNSTSASTFDTDLDTLLAEIETSSSSQETTTPPAKHSQQPTAPLQTPAEQKSSDQLNSMPNEMKSGRGSVPTKSSLATTTAPTEPKPGYFQPKKRPPSILTMKDKLLNNQSNSNPSSSPVKNPTTSSSSAIPQRDGNQIGKQRQVRAPPLPQTEEGVIIELEKLGIDLAQLSPPQKASSTDGEDKIYYYLQLVDIPTQSNQKASSDDLNSLLSTVAHTGRTLLELNKKEYHQIEPSLILNEIVLECLSETIEALSFFTNSNREEVNSALKTVGHSGLEYVRLLRLLKENYNEKLKGEFGNAQLALQRSIGALLGVIKQTMSSSKRASVSSGSQLLTPKDAYQLVQRLEPDLNAPSQENYKDLQQVGKALKMNELDLVSICSKLPLFISKCRAVAFANPAITQKVLTDTKSFLNACKAIFLSLDLCNNRNDPSVQKAITSAVESLEAILATAQSVIIGSGSSFFTARSICSKCNQPIQGTRIQAGNHTFHAACYACCTCGVLLKEAFIFQNQLYCKHDYIKKVSIACSVCKIMIHESFLDINGKYYHNRCFKCNNCGVQLTGEFITRGEHNYCPNCLQ